jgi:transposase
MTKPNRYSPEVRERAVRMLYEQEASHPSRWAAMQSIAQKIGCTAETLRKWVERAEIDGGLRPGLTTSELDEFKALKRENRELKQANEILRKASAFFAQAELDRKAK